MFPYLINATRRFAQVTLTGSVTGAGIVETVQAIYDDPAWRPGFDIVWNCAGVAALDFSSADVAAVSDVRRKRSDAGGAGRDVVVIARVLDDGMVRFYAAMRQHDRRRTQLCASESKALELLAHDSGAEPT